VNVGPENTFGASMKSKPWDFRLASTECIYSLDAAQGAKKMPANHQFGGVQGLR
jgi:hypothetical protein